ncbi:MAG: M48 family metalloprotease [Treponema sp.]|nr:M48 family metalloprotease [Treponema sp.]
MRKMPFFALFCVFVLHFSDAPAFAAGQNEFQPPAAGFPDMDALLPDVSDAFAQMDEALSAPVIDMTLEDEYFLGRAVAAEVLRAYGAYAGNPALTAYLNKIALAITINSPKPSLFSGYQVAILDTDEIAAFATPGGHIFLSRGLIAIAPSEDALAAVIAHEIAHIQLRHVPAVLANQRAVQELSAVAERAASIAARHLSDQERIALFQVSLSAATDALFRDGFSRDQEFQADRAARVLLANAGYDPAALEEMLRLIGRHQAGGGMIRTHPSPEARIANLQSSPVGRAEGLGRENLPARRARFSAAAGR